MASYLHQAHHVVHPSRQLTTADALAEYLNGTRSRQGVPDHKLAYLERISQGMQGRQIKNFNASVDVAETPAAVSKSASPEAEAEAEKDVIMDDVAGSDTDENGVEVEIVKSQPSKSDGWQSKENWELRQGTQDDDEGVNLLQDQAHPGGAEQPLREKEVEEEMRVEMVAKRQEPRKDGAAKSSKKQGDKKPSKIEKRKEKKAKKEKAEK